MWLPETVCTPDSIVFWPVGLIRNIDNVWLAATKMVVLPPSARGRNKVLPVVNAR